VNTECIAVLRALEDGTASGEVAAHLDACPVCRRHRALLGVLADLPPGEVGEEAVASLLQSLPHARWQLRRLSTWLPALVAFGLMGGGLTLLGGVPGAGAVPSAGHIAGAAASWAAAWAADVATVLRGSAGAVSALIAAGGVWLLAWLGLTGIGGGWLVYALVRQRPGGRR
jgi:hypothetical protein